MTGKTEFAFSSIPVPEREEKPRKKGLTMMIDWGLPLGLQKDCLEGQGLYVDEAKIAGSIHRVMPADYLKKKIAAYQSEDIFTFPGGLFTELAIAQGNYEVFLEEVKTVGFSGIEVSDNLIQIEPKKKKEVISKAVNEYDLTVMGEVGRKEGSMSGDELIADIENNTSEHINIDVFMNELQRVLINSGVVRFVADEAVREDLMAEVEWQREMAKGGGVSGDVDRGVSGADFVMLGTVSSVVDQADKKAIVYYKVDLSLTDLRNWEKVWIGTAERKHHVEGSKVRF